MSISPWFVLSGSFEPKHRNGLSELTLNQYPNEPGFRIIGRKEVQASVKNELQMLNPGTRILTVAIAALLGFMPCAISAEDQSAVEIDEVKGF